MSVVVTVPHQAEPWKVSGAAFRLLAADVGRLTSDADFMVRAAAEWESMLADYLPVLEMWMEGLTASQD